MLTRKTPNKQAEGKIMSAQFGKNLQYKLYDVEKSKTGGQTL